MTTYYTRELACIRCGALWPETAAFDGCVSCAAQGAPSNLAPQYELTSGKIPVADSQPGLFRYRTLLPVSDTDTPISLGEGRTPALPIRRTGEALGLSNLWIKDESRSPTWSYKDRLAAVAVTKAYADGADTVVVSTTGNHGAAVAAYAAAAGLRCVALTLRSVPETMRTLMQSYGAAVVAYDRPIDRWNVMAEAVKERGWVPMSGFADPPIGSNPFGIDGYKTIAYEIVEQFGREPDVLILPVAYADGLAGIARGFADLHKLGVTESIPRFVAGESFGPYGRALSDETDVTGHVSTQPSVAFSIATSVGTYQGIDALRRSSGTTVAVPDDEEIMVMQSQLARQEGIYLEAASLLPLIAARVLARKGWLHSSDLVVTIGTSTGLKDVAETASRLPAPENPEPTLAALDTVLSRTHDAEKDK